MRMTNWIAGVALLAALGCGQGSEEGSTGVTPARQAELQAIEQLKAELDQKRQQVVTLEQQAMNDSSVGGQLAATKKEVLEQGDELGARLAEYINADPPILGEPMRPDQLAAIRMKSDEDMVVAREYIELGGDYRKAIDIYNSALMIDPDNEKLKAAKGDAESKRYMTQERFAAVAKNMTEAEVVAAIGRPLARNVREYPEKKVTAWFYPKNENGEAAGVFFSNEKKTVYSVDFEAVKRTDQG